MRFGGVDMETIDRLILAGTVMDLDEGNHRVRVIYQDEKDRSGWLYVLQHPGGKVDVETADSHTHRAYLGGWMPEINDQVLVLYLPVLDGDGFVLGKIG